LAQGLETIEYGIPKSRGIPPFVQWFGIIGIGIIVFMGAITIVQAGENHFWPAQDTPTIPLSGSLQT
jgi:hypothetical protein